MLTQLKRVGETFRRELTFYRFVVADPRTPKLAKWLLGLALGYAISPIDLIPDAIPFLGMLDDVLVAGYALRQASAELERYRQTVRTP